MFKFLKKIWHKIKNFFSKKKKKPETLEECNKEEIMTRVREVITRLQTPLEKLPESFFGKDFSKYRQFILEPFVFMRYTRFEVDHPIKIGVKRNESNTT